MRSLRELAASAASVMPDGGTAQLVPVPVLRNGALSAAVLEYSRSHDPRRPLVLYPPRRVLAVDAESGKLVDDGGDGVPWANDQPLRGQNPPRAASVDDWLAKRDRLVTLAPAVWNAFAADVPTLDDGARRALAEYIALSEGTEPLVLRPYLRRVGADFYAWARRVGALDQFETSGPGPADDPTNRPLRLVRDLDPTIKGGETGALEDTTVPASGSGGAAPTPARKPLPPGVRLAHKNRYTPGSTITTTVGGGKFSQRWHVEADGRHLTRLGSATPATPASLAAAVADAAWGPYRPGATVFLAGTWYRIDKTGRATPQGILKPQPPPPARGQHAAQINAARRVPHAPPSRVAVPAPGESAPPASMLPSQIGGILNTVGQGVKVAGQVAATVKSLSGLLSSFGGGGDAEGLDTAIPPPNMAAEQAVNVGLGVLATAYPPWTTALAAAAKIGMSIWNAVDGALRDTFHPDPLEAEEWLTLFRIDPGLLFSGVDKVKTPEKAARLIRYLKLVAGEHPMLPGMALNNPNDSSDNPYQNNVDPTDPLTDPKYLQHIHDAIWKVKDPRLAGHYLNAHPAVATRETAQRLLAILRHGIVQSHVAQWSQAQANLGDIAGEIKRVRRIAGESGPDPELSKLFGDVSLPAARKAMPVASSRRAGRGEAGALEDVPAAIYMRSVVDVLDAGDALFSWRPITVTYKRHPREQGLLATFWVFVDALRDRQSGLRWPCSAAETQMVADRILVAPQDLPSWWGARSQNRYPCLMMTPRLMAARWLHARQSREIIPPHPQNPEDLLLAGVTRMSAAIDQDLLRLTPRDPWVADPGKIWALDRRLFDRTATAINYGEHVDPLRTPVATTLSTNGAIPGLSLVQSVGDHHGPDHIDYSQILLLVAPWCMVAWEGHDAMLPMRTADVYQSADLAGLVTDDAKPLAGLRQPFDLSQLGPARAWFWEQQAGIWRQKQRLGLGVFEPLPRGALAVGRS